MKFIHIILILILSITLQNEEETTPIKGFQINHLHTEINWQNLKDKGYKYGLIRYGAYYDGTIIHCCFWGKNYNNGKKLGFDLGLIFPNYVYGLGAIKQEADTFLKSIKNYKFEYPIFYELSNSDLLKLGKKIVSAIARTFCDTLIENKYSCGFYATAEYIEELFEDDLKTNYPILLQYDEEKDQSNYKNKIDIKELSEEYFPDWIDHDISESESYFDFATYIKENHLNGY